MGEPSPTIGQWFWQMEEFMAWFPWKSERERPREIILSASHSMTYRLQAKNPPSLPFLPALNQKVARSNPGRDSRQFFPKNITNSHFLNFDEGPEFDSWQKNCPFLICLCTGRSWVRPLTKISFPLWPCLCSALCFQHWSQSLLTKYQEKVKKIQREAGNGPHLKKFHVH